jgi:hypothetical protein
MLSSVNASHYLYKETIESGCLAQHDNYAFNPSACCGMHRLSTSRMGCNACIPVHSKFPPNYQRT